VVESPPPDARGRITQILSEIQPGAPVSSDLLPLVYDDLRTLAAARMARLGAGQTLQATELVHEAYLRLVGSHELGWKGRAHFFGAAALSMRDILAEHLRKKGRLKRGGHLRRVGPDTAAQLTCDGPSDDVLAIEEALQEFELKHPRNAKVVTLAFFGGLGTPEIAEVLNLSPRTVERDWRFAKAWLNARLTEEEPPV